ncbi:unnamed protein product [Spirodela intermedia]|uniref:Uncharacterized protein n=1 Tax=Spirodela intermedia TaxID=51605 RepID=A0ABN7E9M5_SPIIN|nr:unnamed protein product [Spirodela intermedia]
MREIEISTLMPLSNDPLSPTCTTFPCPTANWPSVTWKRSGAHVSPSVLATRAPARGFSLTTLLTCLWDPSPSAQETLAVRVQPDRRTKTKEPGFRYTA